MLKNIPGGFLKNRIILILFCFFMAGNSISFSSSPLLSVRFTTINGYKYVSVQELNNVKGMDNTFDVTWQKGKIYRKSHYAIYKTGYSTLIIDNSIYRSDKVVKRWRGGVYIPEDAVMAMLRSFYPGLAVERGVSDFTVAGNKSTPEKNRKTATPVKGKKERIGFIIIDAGHGGKDPGALGKGGLKEKDITLKLALKVENILKKKFRHIKVKLTRKRDRFIELARRTEIANRELRKNYNGIFVSIHVNASIISRISGFETYCLSQNPTNEEARKTAALENNVIILEKNKKRKKFNDVELVEALMMTTQIQKESAMLAKTVQKSLDEKINRFKSKGVHKADFFVLRGSLMPAVLVEVGFITNKKESSYLKKSWYQDRLAQGISQGLVNFIDKYNKTIK